MFDIQERTSNPNNYFTTFGRSEWRMLGAPHKVDPWQQQRHIAYGIRVDGRFLGASRNFIPGPSLMMSSFCPETEY